MEIGRCTTCGKTKRVAVTETCIICGGTFRALTAMEQAAWNFSMARHTTAEPLLRESLAELHCEAVALV
jgi:hypothetical protein